MRARSRNCQNPSDLRRLHGSPAACNGQVRQFDGTVTRMMQVIYGLALCAALALPSAAAAQDQIWLQIEAQPTLNEASDRAQAYAALFPDVSGFSTGGWYAIALGPFQDRAAAEDRLRQLKSEGLIPRDSFIASGGDYRAPFWPAGQSAPVVALSDPGDTPLVAAEPAPLSSTETPEEARAAEAALPPEARQKLQAALQWFGHYDGKIDGSFGAGTRRSMADWQTAQGEEPTGILTSTQRQSLVAAYDQAQAELGLATQTETEAGIEITLPTALVEFDHYEPPFVHFRAKNGSEVQVILISQPGDQSTLYGLYDVLQTLEIMPVEGERSRSEASFTIDGRSATRATHAYAELSKGLVKGYILVWNPKEDARMARVLAAMQSSFRSVGDTALDPGLVPLSDETRRGLMAGLEVRRPVLSRSGFYVDGNGTVATVAEAVEGCNRITLDLRHDARLLHVDPATGLALLTPVTPLSPPAVADLLSGPARSGQDIAVSGYSYEDKLPAPTLTFGTLEEMKGLNGETGVARLSVEVLAGDAGGPVLDSTGTVIGLLLPRDTEGARRLPASVSYALQAATLAPRLSEAGVAPRASTRTGALAPEDLNRLAEGMTVLVSCW